MERFWSLKFLQQQAITQLDAQVVRDFPDEPPVVRAANLPLVFPLLGAPPLRRGQQVRVRLTHLDALSLDIRAEFVALVDEAQALDAPIEEDDLPAPSLVMVMDASEPQDPAP
jgi:exoribonuclease-2